MDAPEIEKLKALALAANNNDQPITEWRDAISMFRNEMSGVTPAFFLALIAEVERLRAALPEKKVREAKSVPWIRKANRPHTCVLCHSSIRRGERYIYAKAPGLDRLTPFPMHQGCHDAAIAASKEKA